MISLDDIRSLAQLARLKLTRAEEEGLQKDISNILEYVGQVNAVAINQTGGNTSASNAEELAPVRNVMREDAPAMLLGKREMLLAAFPKREPARPDDSGRSGGGEYLVVRKIIDKDE